MKRRPYEAHGLSRTPEYRAWNAAKKRCSGPSYRNYHGRGLTVCDRWRDSFENFLADMGPRPDGCSLDRIDNERGYEPGNCRWADRETQANNRRTNRLLTLDGRTQTITDWARELGLTYSGLRNRIRYGWTMERVLSQAKQKHRPREAPAAPLGELGEYPPEFFRPLRKYRSGRLLHW